MARVLVTGATGALGSAVVTLLVSQHCDVRILVHRPTSVLFEGVEVCSGDLPSGMGVQQAVEGVDAIIHCASDARQEAYNVDVVGTRMLLQAAQTQNPLPHILYISIVGIEQIPFSYYKAKLQAEEIIMQSALPWTILRATQFHGLILTMLKAAGVDERAETVVPAGLRFQSIDHSEVAQHLVSLLQKGPAGRVPDIGGPQVLTFEEMIQMYARIQGKSVHIRTEQNALNDFYNAFRTGHNLIPEHAEGKIIWEEYLRMQM